MIVKILFKCYKYLIVFILNKVKSSLCLFLFKCRFLMINLSSNINTKK